MLNKIKTSLLLLSLILGFSACKDKEKYSPVKDSDNTPNTETTAKPVKSFKDDVHTVTINEILKTERYLYINVTEKNNINPFWIATRKMDVKVGGTYFYKGGLLKTNFESKEFKRTFDKIYLVSSNLVPANHAADPNFGKNPTLTKKVDVKAAQTSNKKAAKSVNVKGSIKIANLVKNAKKYAGKTVQISGTCTKINAGIMNRNWIHIKDGSKDDYDLVVTSKELVQEGATVTLKATVTLNKDFGAGYSYDLILENASIVH